MNNIEERIENLKANIALSELIGPDELTVTVSDLSALIAQLEAAQKERDELRDKFNEMSVQKQFWVKCAKELESQLEAAQKSNAFLKEQMAQLANFNPDWDRLEACQESWRELAELQKETLHRAEKAEAELSAANEKLQVPTGYCIMPESLTAENGAKGALSGEFFTVTEIACEECCCDYDEDDPCENCNGFGVKKVRTAIGWSTIKDIYKMAVGATAIRPVGFTVEGE